MKCPGKCDFSSEKELSVTQGFIGELRSGGSQAEAWDVQQTWERNFRREEKGMKDVIKTPGLQAWATCRATDRHASQLEREPHPYSGRGGPLISLGKVRGLVWDILSFKQ